MKRNLGSYLLLVLLLAGVGASKEPKEESEETSVTVLVKEAETGNPIPQARLTLRFRDEPEGAFNKVLKRAPKTSWSAKTNAQGRYKFLFVPKHSTVILTVTAKGRQSFGREFDITEENQLLEVKLKKPQPLV